MKKIISLLLVFAFCLSLCACGGTSDPEPETQEAEAAPEETLSQEEYLEELLLSENWCRSHGFGPEYKRYVFLKNGYGIRTGSSFGLTDTGDAFQWVLNGNKLLLMFDYGQHDYGYDEDWLFTYDEEKSVFTCISYVGNTLYDYIFFPESRMDEFA